MKLALTGLAAIAALVAVLGVRATASEAAIQARGAVCGVMDGDGSFQMSTNSQVVTSGSGNSMHRCRASVPNSSKRMVRWDVNNTGAMCWTAEGPTRDWHETVSASGQATLVCHHKK